MVPGETEIDVVVEKNGTAVGSGEATDILNNKEVKKTLEKEGINKI